MNYSYELKDLGWNEILNNCFEPFAEKGFEVGRISAQYRNQYKVLTTWGEIRALVSGKMRHNAACRSDFPTVGDWVVLEHCGDSNGENDAQECLIQGILPRKSKFARKTAGRTSEEQIVAANIDTVFLVSALNQDFNLRRIERYLTMAWDSGATPVIILSKLDLCTDVEEKIIQVRNIAPGVDILPLSSATGEGIEAIFSYLQQGHTIALLGSSGVGKSTLINVLLGEEKQATKEIREKDSRGRHTTTSRELFLLPQGGIIIDTPGMRELQLLGNEEGMAETFEDIYAYAQSCRFSDCRHEKEPGCAVQKAIAEGKLSPKRWESFKKLEKEVQYIARKINTQEQLAEKKKWKKISQQIKEHYRFKKQ